jgi:hypothetical protein
MTPGPPSAKSAGGLTSALSTDDIEGIGATGMEMDHDQPIGSRLVLASDGLHPEHSDAPGFKVQDLVSAARTTGGSVQQPSGAWRVLHIERYGAIILLLPVTARYIPGQGKRSLRRH